MLITSILVLGGTGLLIGVILSVVDSLFSVKEDPRFEEILAVLPGVNCGACGYPGCSGYASSIVSGEASANRCTVGGEKTTEAICALMGVEVKEIERCEARVYCRGGRSLSAEKFDYRGITSCIAISITDSGNKACNYGCLGMGDCAHACPFGAIYMSEDKLPVVVREKCRSCGKCVQACPRGLFELVPAKKEVTITCKSHYSGAETRKACKTGCIACGICVKKCPVGAIKIDNNLAVINYSLCTNCLSCVDVCPQKVIVHFPNGEKMRS